MRYFKRYIWYITALKIVKKNKNSSKYMTEGNEVKNIRAFLYKTAKNIIIDESRKKKNISLNQIMEKGFSPSEDMREKNDIYFANKEVLTLVGSLDEKYREVIFLKY